MKIIDKNSFTFGELTPGLHARTDLDQYRKGVKCLENFFVHPTGGVSNRPGTLFVADTGVDRGLGDTVKYIRLIPFQFATDDGYMLEFSNQRIRFIQDDAYITSGGNPVEVSTSYSRADIFELDYAQSGDILFLAHGDYPPMKLSRQNSQGTAWTFTQVTFEDGPYTDRAAGDEDIVLTPSAPLGDVTITASAAFFDEFMVDKNLRLGYEDPEDPTYITWVTADVTSITSATEAQATVTEPLGSNYLFNGDFESGLTGWENWSRDNLGNGEYGSAEYIPSADAVDLQDQIGLLVQKFDYYPPLTLMQVTADFQFMEYSDAPAFFSIDVAAYDTLKTGNWDDYLLTGQAIDSAEYGGDRSTHTWEFRTPKEGVDLAISLVGAFGNNIGVTNRVRVYSVSVTRAGLGTSIWRKFAWGANLGWPRHLCFFEQRLIFASSATYPQTLWMSKTGDFYDFSFSSPGKDDDAITVAIASRKIDSINWMVPMRYLIIGTNSAVWTLSAGAQSDVLTPTSITTKLQSSGGVSNMMPIIINDRILYVDRGQKSIKEIAYRFESDAFAAADITFMSKHIFEHRRIESWAYAELNDNLLYCVMDDGCMAVCCYLPEQQVLGWSRYTPAVGSGYKYVGVLNDTGGDMVYFVMGRDFADSDFIEKQMDRITYYPGAVVVEHEEIEFVDKENERGYMGDYHFLESCSYRAGSSAVSTVYDLEHLAGEEIVVLADGYIYEDMLVSQSGTIALSHPARIIVAGLKYTCRIDTLDLDIVPTKKALASITFNVRESREFFVKQRDHFMFIGGGSFNPTAPGDSEFQYPDYNVSGWEEVVTHHTPFEFKLRSQIIDDIGPIKLRTGKLSMVVRNDWKKALGITILQDRPLPLTILSIMPEITD